MDKSRLRPFGLAFEKSLNDLIRGIRRRRDPELLADYFKQVIAECREEVRSPDMDVKAMAVLKLAYLEMYGFDMSWSAFHILEVMSSSKFQQKRIGYLAAMQSFRGDSELLMLATNLLKTDLASSAQQRVAISLSGLASVVTPLLAVDISDDIIKMLNHSQPYVRKKAILAMYKVILQYPEALQAAMPRLRQKLDDEDTSVVTAAVNVVCELANQTTNPKPYIELAPPLYELLTTSKNNWCLIKILKLFAIFTAHEPRLKSRVLSQVSLLMATTPSLSLLYECINSILRGGMLEADNYELAQTCMSKLRTLIEERDPNLKFVGLEAMSQLAKINPDFVSKDHSIILDCIDDPDITIRRKVLDMLIYLVNDDNLYDIVTQLMEQLRDSENVQTVDIVPDYFEQVVLTIAQIASANNYEHLPNFDWYTDVLVEIAVVSHAKLPMSGEVVGAQLQNVAVRVRSVRRSVVAACLGLSQNTQVMIKQSKLQKYCLWIVGEYIADYLDTSNASSGPQIMANILSSAPSAVSIPAVTKVFARWVNLMSYWSSEQSAVVAQCVADISDKLATLTTSLDLDIQERAVQFLELFRLARDALEQHPEGAGAPPAFLTEGIPSLFSGFEITPVAVTTQLRIPAPEGLDLDTPVDIPDIYLSESEEEFEEEPMDLINDELASSRARKASAKLDPYYIGPAANGNGNGNGVEDYAQVDAPSESSSVSEVTRESSPNPVQVLGSGSSTSASTSAATGRPKVHKVKVEIAKDDVVVGAGDESAPRPDKRAASASSKKPLFQLSNRLNAVGLEDSFKPRLKTESELELSGGSDVIVKHKKVEKKKTAKSKSKEKSTDGKKTKKRSKKEPVDPETVGLSTIDG